MADERILPELLAYKFKATLNKELKGKTQALALVDSIVPQLLEVVPDIAYTMPDPFYDGIIYYHDRIEHNHADEYRPEAVAIPDLNYMLRTAHMAMKDKKKPIQLQLSSFGGDVFEAITVIDTIQQIQREGRQVWVHVPGYAMSAGSVILQAGNHRSMSAHAWLMIHDMGWDIGYKKFHDHEDELEFTKRLRQSFFGMYAARTGRPVEEWIKFFDRRDKYLSPEQAFELKLIDEITVPTKYPRVYRKANA